MRDNMDAYSTNGLSDEQLADFARLVDGTLPADRRAELELHLYESPEAASIVERQAAALDALRGTCDTGARRGCANGSSGMAPPRCLSVASRHSSAAGSPRPLPLPSPSSSWPCRAPVA